MRKSFICFPVSLARRSGRCCIMEPSSKCTLLPAGVVSQHWVHMDLIYAGKESLAKKGAYEAKGLLNM